MTTSTITTLIFGWTLGIISLAIGASLTFLGNLFLDQKKARREEAGLRYQDRLQAYSSLLEESHPFKLQISSSTEEEMALQHLMELGARIRLIASQDVIDEADKLITASFGLGNALAEFHEIVTLAASGDEDTKGSIEPQDTIDELEPLEKGLEEARAMFIEVAREELGTASVL